MTKELEALKQVKNFLGHNYCSVDLPNELKLIEQALQRLEAIENSKPSEALEKLEMLSDCAEAMKEAPSSNWIEYANTETELDYQLWVAYQDLKQYILKAQEQEKVLKIIKEYVMPLVNIDDDCVWDNEGYKYLVPKKEDLILLKRYCDE